VPSSETVKLQCRCGAVIRDQTDFISYKAYLVADEDWFDVLDDVDARRGDDLLRAASRTLSVQDLDRALSGFSRLRQDTARSIIAFYDARRQGGEPSRLQPVA